MPVRRNPKLNRVNGVAIGATATIELPTDVRYHYVVLNYKESGSNVAEADMEGGIDEIRLNLDGVTQWRLTPSQIFDINRKKGLATVKDGEIPLLFSGIDKMQSLIQRYSTAWGMQGVGTFQIEVDIAAGATAPTLSGFASIDDVQEPPVNIVKYKPETIQVGASGELTHKLDNGRSTDNYKGLYFFEGSNGDITDIRFNWDGTNLHDLTDNHNDFLNHIEGYGDVSGLLHVPLDRGDITAPVPMVKKQGDRLVNVQEFLATLTMGGANNVTLVRELVGLPD